MKFAICDDEEIYFDYLRSVISTLEDEEEIWIEYYSTGEKLLKDLKITNILI